MSILSLDNLGFIINDLNEEIKYKAGSFLYANESPLLIVSDGKKHKIMFFNSVLFDTDLEKQLEEIPTSVEMILNEREHLESHLRELITDHLNLFKTLEI